MGDLILPPPAPPAPNTLLYHLWKGTYADVYPRIMRTDEWLADVAVEGTCMMGETINVPVIVIRIVDVDNYYALLWDPYAATADFRLYKLVAGTATTLATEAVDLTPGTTSKGKVQAVGTSLKAWRDDVLKFDVTDTAHASGYWGNCMWDGGGGTYLIYQLIATMQRVATASLSPKCIGYFEVPIIGTGTLEDPFRAQMPEELTTHPELGTRNLLALSHASLIPTVPITGRPIHGTALVRIFEQPDRDPALRDIPTCLDTLRGMAGVTELTREDAISRAKTLDPKLTDFDLRRFSETSAKRMTKEYVRWRFDTFKVEITEEEAIRYLMSDKGW